MSLLEPAVFGQRVRALVHRYYASYIKTGSFAPIWHATFVFGGAGVAISYHVRGGTFIYLVPFIFKLLRQTCFCLCQI